MGLEATCYATIRGKRFRVKAHLDSGALTLRGESRIDIPLREVSRVTAKGGTVSFRFQGSDFALEVGAAIAARWAEKIENPPSLLDKLGIRDGTRVSVLGMDDAAFLAQVAARTGDVATGRPRAESDTIVCAVSAKPALKKLAVLMGRIKPAGQIWVLWPKGRKELTENDVRAAALPLGLVDTKVVSFSETLSGLRLVIRKERRGR